MLISERELKCCANVFWTRGWHRKWGQALFILHTLIGGNALSQFLTLSNSYQTKKELLPKIDALFCGKHTFDKTKSSACSFHYQLGFCVVRSNQVHDYQ